MRVRLRPHTSNPFPHQNHLTSYLFPSLPTLHCIQSRPFVFLEPCARRLAGHGTGFGGSRISDLGISDHLSFFKGRTRAATGGNGRQRAATGGNGLLATKLSFGTSKNITFTKQNCYFESLEPLKHQFYCAKMVFWHPGSQRTPTGAPRDPQGPQGIPKGPPKDPPGTPKEPPGTPKGTPRTPNRPPTNPKGPQRTPKGAPRLSKDSQRQPKDPQRTPKLPQRPAKLSEAPPRSPKRSQGLRDITQTSLRDSRRGWRQRRLCHRV